jgi:biopolymer transport protein ExbD
MPLKTQHDEAPALNLTSMIDVLFLLIIFFMVATKFDQQDRSIDVSVPEVSHADDDPAPPPPLTVTVQPDGGTTLNGEHVSLQELTAKLADAKSPAGDPAVVVRGDAKCAFQHIASVLAACREAGISDLGITVRVASVGDAKR